MNITVRNILVLGLCFICSATEGSTSNLTSCSSTQCYMCSSKTACENNSPSCTWNQDQQYCVGPTSTTSYADYTTSYADYDGGFTTNPPGTAAACAHENQNCQNQIYPCCDGMICEGGTCAKSQLKLGNGQSCKESSECNSENCRLNDGQECTNSSLMCYDESATPIKMRSFNI